MLVARKELILASTTNRNQSPNNRTEEKDRRYLFDYADNPTLMVNTAVKLGDNLVLKLLLDPAPLSDHEILKRKAFAELTEEREKLIRKQQIRQLQIEILAYFYDRYSYAVILHPEEIEEELNSYLFNLQYSFRLAHQQKLKKTKEMFIGQQLVKLDVAWRVKLHKEFSARLSEEFKEASFKINFSNFKEAYIFYQKLIGEIGQIEKSLQSSIWQYNINLREIEMLNLNIEKKQEKYLDTKYLEIIPQLKSDKIINANLNTFRQKIINLKISVNNKDLAGNNFIHLALQASQFETALFLMECSVDYKSINDQGIVALDSQNKYGNTLLHYLITKGQFSKALDLIAEGANFELVNNQGQNIFNLSSTNGSFLHFFINQLSIRSNTDKYLSMFLHIISKIFTLSMLRIKDNEKKTVFSVITSLPEETKYAISETIKKTILDAPLSSQFQKDINHDLYAHLVYLLKESTSYYSWFCKKMGLDEAIDNQLQFLAKLQQHLLLANKNKTDIELCKVLLCIDNFQLPDEVKKSYKLHVESFFQFKKKPEQKYFLGDNPTARNIQQKEDSYVSLMKSGLADKEKAVEKKEGNTPITTNNQPTATFQSPIKKIRKKIEIPIKCADPFHWFDQPKMKC